MKPVQKINLELQRLVAVPVWRFAVGLRIRFNHPTLLYQTYPDDWIAYYAQNGLLFVDPTVRWGMAETGIIDWDDLASTDGAGVFKQAADHGLVHGIAISVGDHAERSLGFFAAKDRAISAEERILAQEVVKNLHDATEGVADLRPAELAPFIALNDQLRPAAT